MRPRAGRIHLDRRRLSPVLESSRAGRRAARARAAGAAQAESPAPSAEPFRLHLRRLPARELPTSSGDQGAGRRMKRKIDMSSQPQPAKGGPPIVTSPLIEVRNSPVHGRGVFAVQPIKKG